MAEDPRFHEIRGEAHDVMSWRELITGPLLPSFQRVEDFSETGFRGRLWRQVIDRVSAHLIKIESTHHVIHRTDSHIKQPGEPLYIVMFQIEGESVFTQAGSTARLKPREFTISTTEVPFDWEFHGDFTVFMLRFPQAFIDAPPQSLLPLTGQALTSRDRFVRHLAPFVESVALDPDLLRGPVGRRIAQNLVDLFTTSVIAHLEERVALGSGASATAFLRITEWIGRHLRDSDLSSAKIAAGNFMSVRTLQSVFQQHGSTVSSWIRERRLGEVRRELALPSQALRPIGDVARGWGFDDQASFSRAFKQEFGETPRQWRSRALSYPSVGDRRPITNDDGIGPAG